MENALNIYYASTEFCEDKQQKEETVLAWLTDVDMWEGGPGPLLKRTWDGMEDDIIKFTLNAPLPNALYDSELKGWRISAKMWNRKVSYTVEDTHVVHVENL